ncbi:hypothetical protein L596_006064 [Steinernema carpocapsae]|uniref:Major facilitator superfamily (MFS) profile domain-containing protein n=1 Tax=Steinernema carpocapsae TaxID=34508 RepID=A0A4U8V2I8_STECR|nr:hypothetical protein L596_006064 [Steinernema carpocapsae]
MPISINVEFIRETMKHQGRLILIMVNIVILAIMPVGFHVVVLNVPAKIIQAAIRQSLIADFSYYIEDSLLSVVWSLLIASQSIGALMGCYFILPLLSSFGTKSALLTFSNCILVIGSLIMAFAYNSLTPFMLIGGRILTGIYTGLACSLVPIYIQEVAPPDLRGAISCAVHIAVCLGSAFGAIFSLDFILGGAEMWPLLMVFPAFLGAVQLILSIYVIPESPNYYIRYQHCGKASKAVDFYYKPLKNENHNAVIFYESLVPEMPDQITMARAFTIPAIRNDIFIGMLVSAAQVFSGSMATISYSTSMFSAVSFVDPLIPYLPAFGSLLSAFLTVPALKLVDTCGRRPLLLYTLCVCAAADFCLMIFSLFSQGTEPTWASYCFGVTFLVYGVGYNLGVGPLAYFIPGELVERDAASVALGSAVSINWLSTLVTTLLYYPLNQAFGGFSYLLFAIPTTFFTIILYGVLPETKPVKMQKRVSSSLGREIERLSRVHGGYGALSEENVN